jgi:pimeloyl-ACP methyl ester carboxylesterase
VEVVLANGLEIAYERLGVGPDPQLVVMPGCGDVTNLEQPEQFNEALREFCRAHSPGPT